MNPKALAVGNSELQTETQVLNIRCQNPSQYAAFSLRSKALSLYPYVFRIKGENPPRRFSEHSFKHRGKV